MIQKLLTIMICLLGISNINAQFIAMPSKTGAQLNASTDGLIYFSYCNDYDIKTAIGYGQATQLSAAIRMPASITGFYTGKTISTIRIGLDSNCTDVSVWIRSSLTGANLVSQTVGNVNRGWTEVTLSTPFTIPNSDLYIGYTATGIIQVGFSGNSFTDGCWWYRNNEWENYAIYDCGSLCIQAGIDPQGATILAMDPESIQKTINGNSNQNFTAQATIKNYSSVNVTSVKASYQIDNQTPVEQNITVSIEPMKSDNINIPINSISSTGIYQLSVKILEINGQANPLANKSLNSEIRILAQSFPRKVVIEEGTGTWCGWCIRGFVGMAMMKQKYPETFIGIAVHTGDEMRTEEYDIYMTEKFFYVGYPSAVINRKKELVCDPHPDLGAEDYFLSEIANSPIADIKLTGGFSNVDKKSISLKTITTFALSANNTNFKLAYVLVENGITGYSQENYYADGVVEMGGYENRPAIIPDMVFDDVARGIYSEPTGITGSISSSITEMVPVEHDYTIPVPSYIKDLDQLEVVVMLLNADTGEIENADMIAISGITDLPVIAPDAGYNVYISNNNLFIESGVSETIDIYSVSGVKIFNTTKTPGMTSIYCGNLPDGLLIVKGSSGWVKKTLNKININ